MIQTFCSYLRRPRFVRSLNGGPRRRRIRRRRVVPTIGKVPPSTICRVPLRQYSLSGEEIRQSAPTLAPDRPDWISKVKPNMRLYVNDSDAARLDSSVRESLVILSNLDAVTSALQHTITDTDAITVPFILRALQYVGGGLADLARPRYLLLASTVVASERCGVVGGEVATDIF